MFSRHVPTRRLKSAVLFSVPDMTERAPDDENVPRLAPHKRNNIRKRAPNVRMETSEDMHIRSAPMLDSQGPFAVFANHLHPSGLDPSTTSSQEKEPTLCLPILKVSLTTTVEGTLSHTTLIQSFRNPSDIIIEEARHTFPLYDAAVITSFECSIGDERRLRGVVKSTEEARNKYKKAKHDQAKAAALLEEHTPEIFETSLGNIPPGTTVEVEIVYVQNLKVVMMEGGDAEGIALIIPTSIAPRYTYSQTTPEIRYDGLDIKILVLKDGRFNPDGCQEESGHVVYDEGAKMLESPQRSDGEYDLNEYHSWTHHSDRPVLKKDFVFIIQLQKGHKMHFEAISCPSDDSGLAAMMVNIRPNDLFRDAIIPQSFSGEILFLLDQSGSMGNWEPNFGKEGGRKVDVLRRAMYLVLTGVPKTCSFNIVSWGSETWAMWEQSRSHSSGNIKEAKEYIDKIAPNMGGTDLLRALKSAVERRSNSSRSTQIVVLTDGELDPKGPTEFVWKTRQELQDQIRFFALGIGANVPHGLIENIAELGGGFGDIVSPTQMPRWEGKLNRLFRSALGADTWDIDIDLGDAYERCSLTNYSLTNSSDTQRASYFQAPQTVSGLPPFRFTSIFFLIDVKGRGVLPREVTIVTTTHETKRKTYKLLVNQAKGRDGAMHQLAAKAMLIDLEGAIEKEPLPSHLIGENASMIGTRYSIPSRWTSFVAVPLDQLNATAECKMVEHYRAVFDGIGINELFVTDDLGSDGSSGGSDASRRSRRTSPQLSHSMSPYARGLLSQFIFDTSDIQDRLVYRDWASNSSLNPIFYNEGLHSNASQSKQSSQLSAKNVFKRLWSKLRQKKVQEPERRESKNFLFEGRIREENEGTVVSSSSNTSRAIDPLFWETAIEYSNDLGLFRLPDSARKLLHLHFCPSTAKVLDKRLRELLDWRGPRKVLYADFIDTLMMVKCYRTHLAVDEEVWDLMMERAEDAVSDAIGQNGLESLGDLLNGSMMHEHYKAATGVTGRQDEGSAGMTTCPICNVPWQSSRTFLCPFDHDPGKSRAFQEWDDFWNHQEMHGHMVCPKEDAEI